MTERPAAVVTGGSAGIGAAISKHLLNAGYDVISLSRGKPDFEHENLQYREVDLADPAATREVADELAKDYNVTSLVNNAGVIRPSLIEEVKLEDLDYLTNLHLGAAITLTQAFLPAMKAAGFGRIVNMSSRAVVGLPTRTNYAGTKAAIISMTRTWAMELGKHGITVNAIAPGPIVTDMFTDVIPEESDQARALAASIPVQRLGNVDDIAEATMFFLKPSSGFVTGQTLFVCGGSSLGSISL
ncbi:SDR family oxidoreductase [Emcibacter sp.]|uniref:SDR family oxidoreductase n=1 Tax=Emcibacter sp. TaxID=1979954 RepID=UPI003A914671